MDDFRNLRVWNEAMDLTKQVYQITKDFPHEETFGLKNQMRRCAVSIPSNIAEGYGRGSDAELIHFLYISRGSAYELDTQLELSTALAYICVEESEKLTRRCKDVAKMITSLIFFRNRQRQNKQFSQSDSSAKETGSNIHSNQAMP